MKTAQLNDVSKQDAKFMALIDDYLRQIKEARMEMKTSKAEIARMKTASRRKLAEIDAVLRSC